MRFDTKLLQSATYWLGYTEGTVTEDIALDWRGKSSPEMARDYGDDYVDVIFTNLPERVSFVAAVSESNELILLRDIDIRLSEAEVYSIKLHLTWELSDDEVKFDLTKLTPIGPHTHRNYPKVSKTKVTRDAIVDNCYYRYLNPGFYRSGYVPMVGNCTWDNYFYNRLNLKLVGQNTITELEPPIDELISRYSNFSKIQHIISSGLGQAFLIDWRGFVMVYYEGFHAYLYHPKFGEIKLDKIYAIVTENLFVDRGHSLYELNDFGKLVKIPDAKVDWIYYRNIY